MTNSNKEQAIIGIISDYILWDRMAMSMFRILNSFHPDESEKDWLPDNNYKGYENALSLLGINGDNKLHKELTYSLHNIIEKDRSSHIEKLAKTVYIDWLVWIREKSLQSV